MAHVELTALLPETSKHLLTGEYNSTVDLGVPNLQAITTINRGLLISDYNK